MSNVNIALTRLDTLNKEDVQQFTDCVIALMRYHVRYAEALGLEDEVCAKYSQDDVWRGLAKANRQSFLIKDTSNNIAGILQIRIENNYFKRDKDLNPGDFGVEIDKIYLKPEFRGQGIAKAAFNLLRDEFPQSKYFRLQCWYDIPAAKVYQALGMTPVCTEYLIINNDT